jgi:hypothetical protein
MAADLAAIEAEIVDALETVTDLTKVYDHEPLEVNTLPAATIFYTGFNAEDISMPNMQNVVHNWIIRLYVVLIDAEAAQDDIKELMTAAITALKQDRSLNRTCLFTQTVSGSVGVAMAKNNPQMVAELNFAVTVREN